MKNRVFIAIPSGRGAPDIDCVVSVQATTQDLRSHGIEHVTRFIHGNCYIALVRSLFAHQFMQTDCTHLFFWDDDVAAPPGALRRLLSYDRDIIVAPYPKKVDPKTPANKAWPYALTDGIPDAVGLLEADMVATGFLLIKRAVIETMHAKYADRTFHHAADGIDVVDIFPTGILEGFPKNAHGKNMWWGEDYAFSVLAKRLGFSLWLDPKIQLIHAGRNVWRGDFARAADDADTRSVAA